MSRNEAKRRFTLADHEQATAGVECRKDEGVIDETPAAYKNIDAVMAAQSRPGGDGAHAEAGAVRDQVQGVSAARSALYPKSPNSNFLSTSLLYVRQAALGGGQGVEVMVRSAGT